jgi:DNA polymerase III epsilon subunit-like protein
MYLFFDTETTGKPRNYKAPMHDLDNWPRVIQLAWLLVDQNNLERSTWKYLIKPDGWEIPKEPFWLEHGYDTDKSLAEGVPLRDALDSFLLDLNEAEHLVAHNMAFDYPVLGSELIRAGLRGKKLNRICTMDASVQFCQIPFPGRRSYPGAKAQGYKWPKLEELHRKLFNEDFDGAHDALVDVQAMRRCFFELVKRGVITPGETRVA